MTANPKRIPVRIVNPPSGCRNITSLAHARRYVARGVARFTATGSLEFIHRGRTQSVEVVPFRITDSGFNTAPYPIPTGVSGGLSRQYPGLAQMTSRSSARLAASASADVTVCRRAEGRA